MEVRIGRQEEIGDKKVGRRTTWGHCAGRVVGRVREC